MPSMKLFLPLVCLVTVAFFGCGSSTLKKGQQLKTLEDVGQKGELKWEDETTESFDCTIPAGSVIEVLYTQRPGINVVECTPLSINGETDEMYIDEQLLPPHILNKGDYKEYTLVIDANLVGTKFERVDKEK